MRMRVAHVDTGMTWRGGQVQVFSLARGLLRRGHEALVICPPGSELEAACSRDGVQVETASMRAELDVVAMLKVAGALRRFGADIVHFHTARAHTIGLAAARLACTPVKVLSRRVDFPPGKNPFSKIKYRAKVDAIAAVSGAVRDVLEEGGVDPNLITVIHSGVDLERFKDRVDSSYIRGELGIPESAPLVGSVGALAPQKAHSYLLRAARELADVRPDVRYIIVGDGELEGELKALARSLHLEEIVRFAGFRRDVPAVLAAIDVFVLSSRYEGTPNVLLEAMAAGTPVVATCVGGVPEIVVDGECGLLVPPADPVALADAIHRALRDDSLRQRLVANGAIRVRDFSVERTIEKTELLYHKLVRAKKGILN